MESLTRLVERPAEDKRVRRSSQQRRHSRAPRRSASAIAWLLRASAARPPAPLRRPQARPQACVSAQQPAEQEKLTPPHSSSLLGLTLCLSAHHCLSGCLPACSLIIWLTPSANPNKLALSLYSPCVAPSSPNRATATQPGVKEDKHDLASLTGAIREHHNDSKGMRHVVSRSGILLLMHASSCRSWGIASGDVTSWSRPPCWCAGSGTP
jgi:hypothetical protein